ncbi:MAG TPA: MBOAT family O-acyltransferase [Bryobacteraceae bacterium]|nr:MBOAT family O-acyltransferase [Bryobacteraceae bacterium]
MSFDTFPFWAFVAGVWLLWTLTRHNAARKVLLTAASYAFYASWSLAYLVLLAGFTLLSFLIGSAVRGARRLPWMLGGVAACVAALAFAKTRMTPLPIGVSFYALQAIAYIVDCYRGNAGKPAGILDYSLYMSFFPRLTAGPIVRAEEFLPQLAKRVVVDSAALWESLVLISFGMFKKLVIADNLAAVADPIFSNLHTSPSRILLATYAFTVQIYCDFSGYTDIALGVARLFGYKLPENFNWPYLARNPADFWRRWHISLSNWLREYIFFSLPGQRSKLRIFPYLNFLITMLICGIWHGTGWTFVLWGLYHGVLLAGYYAIRGGRRPASAQPTPQNKIASLCSILLMQQLTAAGWTLFRLARLSDLPVYLHSLVTGPFHTGFTRDERMALWFIALTALAHIVETRIPLTRTALAKRWNPWVMWTLLMAAIASAVLSLPKQQMFLYFRF